MRRQSFRASPAWAAALMGVVSLGGCKKESPTTTPPVAAAPADAGTATAAAPPAPAAKEPAKAETRTPFVFKDVKIAKVGGDVKLAYTLVNEGPRRARAMSCLVLIDKDGYFHSHLTLGPISLKGGESDVFEDTASVYADVWEQIRSVRLYASASCYSATSDKVSSQVNHLDPTGKPVPPGTPAPRQMESAEDGTVVFDVKDVSLSQTRPEDSAAITFTVTNTSPLRLNASLCVRLYDSAESVGDLDQATSDYFNLAPGASATLTSQLTLDDEQHWDSVTVVKAYAANFGCSNSARQALSNVVEIPKPDHLRAPPPEETHPHDNEPTVDDENAGLVDESGALPDEEPSAD
ncbi:hypothetical protein ACLESO_10280 [Pyxidicoccus sp. 3LG]